MILAEVHPSGRVLHQEDEVGREGQDAPVDFVAVANVKVYGSGLES